MKQVGFAVVAIISFLMGCQGKHRFGVITHSDQLPDARQVEFILDQDLAREGRGFTASIDGLPIVASDEALRYIGKFLPLTKPRVSAKGPDFLILFQSGTKEPPEDLELTISHRFVREVRTFDQSGERSSKSFPAAQMPSSTISTP